LAQDLLFIGLTKYKSPVPCSQENLFFAKGVTAKFAPETPLSSTQNSFQQTQFNSKLQKQQGTALVLFFLPIAIILTRPRRR